MPNPVILEWVNFLQKIKSGPDLLFREFERVQRPAFEALLNVPSSHGKSGIRIRNQLVDSERVEKGGILGGHQNKIWILSRG